MIILLCEQHIKATSDFAARSLGNLQRPLHKDMSKARSYTSATSRFKLLPSTTTAYWNSVLPALSRCLVDRNVEQGYYLQELSEYVSSSPLPLLYHCFNLLKFIEETDNSAFQVCRSIFAMSFQRISSFKVQMIS